MALVVGMRLAGPQVVARHLLRFLAPSRKLDYIAKAPRVNFQSLHWNLQKLDVVMKKSIPLYLSIKFNKKRGAAAKFSSLPSSAKISIKITKKRPPNVVTNH